MSSAFDARSTKSHSQLLAEDPDEFVQRLKQRLALKEGIPESQQRLVFSVSNKQGRTAALAAERAAEDIVGELHSWQAILFQNNKAVGRLVRPHISAREEHSKSFLQAGLSGSEGIAVESISVEYDHWQPAPAQQGKQPQWLSLPIDKTFLESSYRIQVIGQSKGKPLAVPISYVFSGSTVAQALDSEIQRAEYIRKHQLARGQALQGSQHLRSISVNCGAGLGCFLTVFNAEAQPPWLKGIALQFAVVASKILDEGAPDCAPHTMSHIEPELAHNRHKEGAEKRSREDNQETKDSWLPKLVGPVPSSGRKSRAKQKGRKAGQGKHVDEIKPETSPSIAAKEGSCEPDAPRPPGDAAQVEGERILPAAGPRAAQVGNARPPGHAELPKKGELPLASGRQGVSETGGRRVPPPAVRMPQSTEAQPGMMQEPSPSRGHRSGLSSIPAAQDSPKADQSSSLVTQGTGYIKTGGPTLAAGRASAPDSKEQRASSAESMLQPPAEKPGWTASNTKASKPGSRLKHAEIMTTPKATSHPAGKDPGSPAGPQREQAMAMPPGKAPKNRKEPAAVEDAQASEAAGTSDALSSSSKEEGGLGDRQSSEEEVGASGEPHQETSSSGDSLQTAFSDLLTSSPGGEARRSPPPFGSLLRAGNSGAHSSTGASFRTYGSAESGRSGMANDEDPLASSLPGPYQTPDEDPPSPAWPLVHSASAPPVPSRPTSVNEAALADSPPATTQVPPAPVVMPAMQADLSLEELRAENLRLLNLYSAVESNQGNGRAGSSGNQDSSDNQSPPQASKEDPPQNGNRNSQMPRPQTADSPNSTAILRVRPHSSVDLTARASEPALPAASSNAALHLPSQRIPVGGPYLSAAPAADQASNGTASPLYALVPNGYSSLAEQGIEAAADTTHQQQRPGPSPRPVSANLPAYAGHSSGPRTRSHDSLEDSGNRALLAELQREMAARGSLEGGRISRPGFMTPPPPPPPRTPPLGAMYPSASTIERQGSFQVPQPLQSTIFDSHSQPSCDLERLLSCVTPVLMVDGKPATGEVDQQAACLNDVWSFFEEASAYGREVYTRSGRRGPALAYYTPFLSAIRAFLPTEGPDDRMQGAEIFVRPLAHHFESEPPFNREPLADAVLRIPADPLSGLEDKRWQTARICDLHPSSWFAVAWYPIYRIPDAPLAAKFLTYHSLQPKLSTQTHFGVASMGRPVSSAVNSSEPSPLCLPILGLKCAEQRGEPWLEMYDQASGARMEWEHRLWQLQKNADSLSAGSQLRVLNAKGEWEQPRRLHADLDWFNRHP